MGKPSEVMKAKSAIAVEGFGSDRALRRTGTIFHYWLTDLERLFAAQAITTALLSIEAASEVLIGRAIAFCLGTVGV
jgi:hypothetical protein